MPFTTAHRAEYDAVVVAPMGELIEEMDVRLATFAPEIIGDPKRSMFRIYRDIRFSKDKSPYKTHAACWFYHRDGRSGEAAFQRAGRGGDVEAGAARLRTGPRSGAVAAVPVVHAGPRVAGRSGPGRATAGAARRGFPADRTAGAVDQRSLGTQTSRAAVAAAGRGAGAPQCFVAGSSPGVRPSLVRRAGRPTFPRMS